MIIDLESDDVYDDLSISDLSEGLNAKSIIIRARSLAALARRTSKDKSLLQIISDAICSQKNLDSKIMGLATVSSIGLYVLLSTENQESVSTAKKIISKLEKKVQDDILYWLNQVMEMGIEIEQYK